MNLPNQVVEILAFYLQGIKKSLDSNLVGIYLRGSLASGDFILETSDIDVLVVTDQPVDDTEFNALAVLHEKITSRTNPFANKMESAYIDRVAVKRFQPGLRHPTLEQGETLAWAVHDFNWVIERWTVQVHGITLLGPPPQSLIDPVSPEELFQSVQFRLKDWVEWAQNPDDPEWHLPRSHKAYVVETMCRALYTLEKKTISSKAGSVTWALGTLPEPWRSTVSRSRKWRKDNTIDPDIVAEVRDFVLWVGGHK